MVLRGWYWFLGVDCLGFFFCLSLFEQRNAGRRAGVVFGC